MKRFIKYFLLFVMPILVIGVTCEVLLRRVPNNYKLKKAYLDKNSNDIQTLILGSSHLFYGIDPAFIQSQCFNAGNVSQPLEYDYLMLKKYNEQWRRLSKIVIPIDYFSLYSDLEASGEGWRRKNYRMYFEMGTNHSTDDVEIFNSNLNVNMQRLYNFYLSKEPGVTCSSLGWGTSYSSNKNKDLLTTGPTAAKWHTMADDHLLKGNLRYLNSIIRFAKTKNIQVILITCPTYKSYYGNLNPIQLHRTIAETNKLAKRYHLQYVNMLQDQSFNQKDFYDGDHVNEIGAKKLTLKVDSLLRLNTLSAKL